MAACGAAVGKTAQVGHINCTGLSSHELVCYQLRLWLVILAYNLGNSLRRLRLRESI